MKKGLSILLALVMVLSIFTVIPVGVSAGEADIAETGTSKTRDEAVQWINSKVGKGQVGDGECAAFASAYIYYLEGYYHQVNGKDYATNYPRGWTPHYASQGYTPQPGDLVSWPANQGVALTGYGHVGIVLSCNGSSLYFADQNWNYTKNILTHTIAYSSWNMACFITPNFSDFTPTCTLNNASLPATVIKGQTMYLSGTLSANGNIGWAWTGIRNAANETISINGVKKEAEANPNSTSYDITNISKKIDISNLPAGEYYWQVDAQTGGKYFVPFRQKFTVVDPPIPGKPSFTKFELINWSDGTFRQLNLGWNKTANTTAYAIHIYDYNTGAEVKKYSYNDPDCTSATLNYSDIIPGLYYVQIKSYNAYNVTAGEKREATFIAPPTPTSAWVRTSKNIVAVGEEVTFTYGGIPEFEYNFYLTVKRDGNIVFDENVNLAHTTGKTLSFDTPGTYTASVKVQHNSGTAISPEITFYVFEPVTLGSDFKANMLNAVYSNTQRVLTGSGDNVIVSDKLQNKDEEKWHFELQSDRSYKITNLKNGNCLDITGGTVKLAADNGSDEQRFYAVYHSFGFIMVSKTTGLAIDLKDGSVKLNPYDPSANNSGQPFSVDGYFDTTPYKTMTYNGHTYELYLVRMPWNQAERFCEHKGGHLVTITSAEEQEKVYGMCENSGYAVWLGGSDWGREGEWYWVTGEKFEYSNWHIGRPTGSTSSNHAALYAYDSDDWGHGIWNDWENVQRISSTRMYTICEYDNGDVNADTYKPVKTVEHNGIKYEMFDASVDWLTAEAICEAKGGHLVLIDNAELNGFVKDMIADGKMSEYWINGTDRFNEGIWTDHAGKVLSYINWSEGSPQNDFNTSDYAVIRKSGLWRDQKNINSIRNGTIGFICEYTPSPASVKLNKDDISLSVGKTYQLKATVTPAKAEQTVTWRSSKTSVATVDKDGKVKAVGVGTAIIYAETAKGLAAPCIVTVEESSGTILGDTDGDGEVTILDTTAIQRHLASLTTESYNETAADADKDGVVTILDVTAIQRHLAGISTKVQGIGEPV